MSVGVRWVVAAAVTTVTVGLIGAPAAGVGPPRGGGPGDTASTSVRLVDLGVLGTGARAHQISDRGVVIGSFTAEGGSGAFRWEDGELLELEGLGGPNVTASDVDDRGRVVGESTAPDGTTHAVLWEPDGTVVDLGTPGASSTALGINRHGEVVGAVFGPDGPQAVVWRRDRVALPLGDLGGRSTFPAQPGPAINASGQVVGSGIDALGAMRAFRWDGGELEVLLAPDGTDTFTRGVNRRGEAVGGSSLHALVWDARGRATEVTGLGGELTVAVEISARGDVAGYAQTLDGATHAILVTDGGTTDLGTLGGLHSQANAINRRAQVVGTSDVGSGSSTQHAVLWDDGAAVDLGTLEGDWSQALDINRRGEVVGYSRDEHGTEHAVLWVTGRSHRGR